MPSQRARGLKLVGCYVTQEEHDELAREAAAKGVTLADLFRQIIGATHLSDHPTKPKRHPKHPSHKGRE